ncbi:MAG: hypothetical protein MR051_01610 [Lentisphaeria bacterium]|nr:hypothetical protein [Lentisphaeria bacterium]
MKTQWLIFLSGLGWGGLWAGEFAAYPEVWFFAFAAIGVGLGILTIRALPERFRAPAEFFALLLPVLLPAADLRSAALPLVFGLSCGGSLQAASTRWLPSRNLCGGLLLGTMLTLLPALIPPVAFPLCLLGAGALNFSDRRSRIAAMLAAIGVIGLIPKIPPPPDTLTPGAVLSALSLVEPGPEPARVILTGGNREVVSRSAGEILAAVDAVYAEQPAKLRQKADLIIAATLSPLADGGVRTLTENLKPGGVLVIPAPEKNIFSLVAVTRRGADPAAQSGNVPPNWEWHPLPGTGGTYLVGAKGRSLTLDPDAMDAALERHWRDRHPEPPLPGALAGMLTHWQDRVIRLVPGGVFREMWFIPSIAAALLLALGALPRRDGRNDHGDAFRLMFNCAGYAMLLTLLLPQLLEVVGGVPGVSRLLPMLGIVWFLRRPAEGRRKFARHLGLAAVILLLFSLRGPWYWQLTALLAGGYAGAELDGELRRNIPEPVDPMRFLAIAAGVGAAGVCEVCGVSPELSLGCAAACRFYSWLRN